MDQTAGKIFARRYFYEEFLAGMMPERALRSCNFLTLLGEDMRELEHLQQLGVPLYRIFSVESDHSVYQKQRVRLRTKDLEVVVHYADLAEYIHSYKHTEHRITVFNLDICGQFLKDIDPILGELLLFTRRNPTTVIATYTIGARDRETLMEGLKSLVILLWLAPEAAHRLVRNLYSQYRSAAWPGSDRDRERVAKNMLLRTLFWLRSHMEYIMVGSYSLGFMSDETVHGALAAQTEAWRQFIQVCKPPFTYGKIVEAVESLPRPDLTSVRMDVSFGEVEMLTYAATSGFYHNCYFATYEHDGSTAALDTWLAETSVQLRRNRILLVDANGNICASTHGQVAVQTDAVVLWDRGDLLSELRLVAVPPQCIQPENNCMLATQEELSKDTIKQIRELACKHPDLSSSEISAKLSLHVPMSRIVPHVAVARRKT